MLIDNDETSSTSCDLIRFIHELDALRTELALELARIGTRSQWPSIGIPAGIEGQDVLVEHALKEAAEAKFLRKFSRRCEVSDHQTDRKSAAVVARR